MAKQSIGTMKNEHHDRQEKQNSYRDFERYEWVGWGTGVVNDRI